MINYTENHHLHSDADGVSAHVVVHLQGADLPTARLFVLEVQAPPDGILWPQTSGPCVHYDPDGTAPDDGDGEHGEHQDSAPACAYPSERGALCPHLDNPDVLCPVKDGLYAMHEVARMREACEAEQGERDADMAAGEAVYETETPEFVEPAPDEVPVYEIVIPPQSKRKDGWSEDEMWVIARTDNPAEAVEAYRFRFPDSTRTDLAIKSQWRKLRSQPPRIRKPPQMAADNPTPDFAGDTAPITQHEEIVPDETDPEPTPGKGFYGDARALHADMMDGMMCDRPLSPEPRGGEKASHPWLGMRVRVLDPLDLINRTGTVIQYSLDPREMLVALDDSNDRVWLPPESLLLIGAGRASA